jgi:HKD family nuclease
VVNSTYLQASDPNSMRDMGVAKNVEYKFDAEPSTSKHKTTLNFFDSDHYTVLKSSYKTDVRTPKAHTEMSGKIDEINTNK